MKKEKQIKAYTRRTKSGKMVAVKAHTAKYDAADMAKEALKKKGAGDEFEQRYRSQFEKKPAGAGSTGRIKKETDQDKAAKLKEVVAKLKKAKASDTAKTKPASKADSTAKKQPVGGGSTGRVKKDATTKKTVPTKSADSTSVSSADFKTWYHDPHSATGKKVATQLRKQLGIAQYNRLNKQADESYSTRGHLAMYKTLSGTPAKTPAGSGSTGRTKKTSGDSEKLTKFKEVVSKLKKAKEADMTKKKPVGAGSTGRVKKTPKVNGVREYDRGPGFKRSGTQIEFVNGELGSAEDYSKAIRVKNPDKVLKKAISEFRKDMRAKYGSRWE